MTPVELNGDKNRIGLTLNEYKGAKSTLCPGCGHDAITGSIIQAAFEAGIEPHRVAKLSGIGCSSKTPAYFLGRSHGFNAVHGRMPSIASAQTSIGMSSFTRPDFALVPTSAVAENWPFVSP